MLLVSRSTAAKSDASTYARACVGATRTVGEAATIQTLSQKDGGRHSLHPATRRVDDRLHRRAGTSNPTDLPSSTWVVSGWASHQSSAGLQPRRGEDLGVWRIAGS